ncbi:phosphatidylinositol-binding clathrin assembly protein isoform X2 [Tachysurus ichikawai]
MSGQSITDRIAAAQHSMTGSSISKAVCKATTHEVSGPKKKHLDYLIHCTNEMNVNVPQLADTLFERTANSSWVVVFKALITTHHLMMYGNESREVGKLCKKGKEELGPELVSHDHFVGALRPGKRSYAAQSSLNRSQCRTSNDPRFGNFQAAFPSLGSVSLKGGEGSASSNGVCQPREAKASRFIQYLASRNTLFNLNNFLDKGALQGYDMSTFIRRYSRYLNEKALSYRLVAVDFTKMKRG